MWVWLGLKGLHRQWVWSAARWLHRVDFAWILPILARLPLSWGYQLAKWRGNLNARLGRDWRSMALGFRHIRTQSLMGLRLLPLKADERSLQVWRDQRFIVEARDEFEARLVAAGRVNELVCRWERWRLGESPEIVTSGPPKKTRQGVLWLTPHFDSFFLGVAFLARNGERVNLMSSAVTHDPRVDDAVKAHFTAKYRGLEHWLNGGQVLDMERGMRPFYRMLETNEALVILGDAPVLPQGVASEVSFLGERRRLAGGALRMAQKMNANLGGYVCVMEKPGHYMMRWCEPGPARDLRTVERVYALLSDAILERPGHWWGSDLLPNLPSVAQATVDASYSVLLRSHSSLTGTQELAFGLAQLQRLWPGTNGRWLMCEEFFNFANWAAAADNLPRFLLVLTEPSLLGTAELPTALAHALQQVPHAACAVADDARFAEGAWAAGYSTLADLETHIQHRQGLPVAQTLDDVHLGMQPLAFMLDLTRLRDCTDWPDWYESAVDCTDWPRRLSALGTAILAPRAYVHSYADYQQGDRAEMLNLLPQGVQRLLDVGGGEGRFLELFMAQRKAEGVLVEPGHEAACRAREKGIRVYEAGIETLMPDEMGVFDAVSFLDVLEHLEDPLAALYAARRLLKPEGLLLVSVPNVGYWPIVRDLMSGRFDYLPVGILCHTHVRFFTATGLKDLLQTAGFSVAELRRHGPQPSEELVRWLEVAETAGLPLDRENLATESLQVLARLHLDN